jgi:ribosomal protein L13E
MAMLFCQVGRAFIARDLRRLGVLRRRLKHLGVPVAHKKPTLAYTNGNRPRKLHQTVFEQTLQECQGLVSSRGGRKEAGCRRVYW